MCSLAYDTKEESSPTLDYTTTKAAIYKAFEKFKKWREESMQQFQSMQHLETEEKLNRLANGNKMHFENKAESPQPTRKDDLPDANLSSAVQRKNIEYYETLQESSITDHLQRCFDDSSQSSPSIAINALKSSVLSEIFHNENLGESKDLLVKDGLNEKSSLHKPKRNFLKKGTGLLRYMPKSAINKHFLKNKASPKSNISLKKNHLPQKVLKLKPAIRNTNVISEQVKCIRFDIPEDVIKEKTDNEVPVIIPVGIGGTSSNYRSPIKINASDSIFIEYKNENTDKVITSCSSSENYVLKNDPLDLSISENESLNLLKENRELEEFELLENFVQNNSFNSDCSLDQRLLNVEKATLSTDNQKEPDDSLYQHINNISNKEKGEIPSNSSFFSPKFGLSKYLNHARKLYMEPGISDLETIMQSVQKEISSSKQEVHLGENYLNDRCSTPIEDISLDEKSLLSQENSTLVSFDHHVSVSSENIDNESCNYDCEDCNVNAILKDVSLEEEYLVSKIPDLSLQNNEVSNENIQIHKRLQEREKELERKIEIYQQHNQKLSVICKERDEVLKNLKKAQEDFNKYKEAEKKKFEAELEEKQRQFWREKETFTRLQKLSKDIPTRKYREELNTLRQEVKKLQEELKRQKIKHTSETRKLKNHLDAAEKERDNFKLENIRLEEHVEDLMSASKARDKKCPEVHTNQIERNSNKIPRVQNMEDNITKNSSLNDSLSEYNVQKGHLEADLKLDKLFPNTTPEKKIKSKVRFNLENGNQDNQQKCIETALESEINSFDNRDCFPDACEHNDYNKDFSIPEEIETAAVSISTIFVNDGSETKEMDYVNNIPVPEQIQMTSVNLSVISVSVECEFKEVDYGNQIERFYKNGEREIIFQSGTRKFISADGKTTKYFFRNGDIKEIFPNKQEVYKYTNGKIQTKFPDGLDVTEYTNGQIQKNYPDGRREAKYPDGSIYKRFADGSEEIRRADGSLMNFSADGTGCLEFSSGQRVFHTPDYERREFPDGSVKITFSNGKIETRYSNGRIRIKDKDGNVIVDTDNLPTSKD